MPTILVFTVLLTFFLNPSEGRADDNGGGEPPASYWTKEYERAQRLGGASPAVERPARPAPLPRRARPR
jgi:hypothetical protein